MGQPKVSKYESKLFFFIKDLEEQLKVYASCKQYGDSGALKHPDDPNADGCSIDRYEIQIVPMADPRCATATFRYYNDKSGTGIVLPTLWSRQTDPTHLRITNLKGPTMCLVDKDAVEDAEEILRLKAEEQSGKK